MERGIRFGMLIGPVPHRPIFSPVTWYKFWRALAHFPRDIRSLFPDHGSNSLRNIANYTQIHTASFPQNLRTATRNMLALLIMQVMSYICSYITIIFTIIKCSNFDTKIFRDFSTPSKPNQILRFSRYFGCHILKY